MCGWVTGLSKPLCDAADGFTLHAARTVPAHDREGLEQLCRYGLRPPFSNDLPKALFSGYSE
jgi:hypothetical protein